MEEIEPQIKTIFCVRMFFQGVESNRVLTDDVLMLIQKTKGNNALFEKYQNEWTTGYSTISVEEFGQVMRDFGFKNGSYEVYRNPEYENSLRKMLEEGKTPISFRNSLDKEVLFPSQAIFYIFENVVCWRKWNVDYCSKHRNCLRSYREVILETMEKYRRDPTTLVDKEAVDKDITHLKTNCAYRTTQQPQNPEQIVKNSKFKDLISKKFYEEICEYYGFLESILSRVLTDTTVGHAMHVWNLGWCITFFGNCPLAFCVIDAMHYFVPEERLEEYFRFRNDEKYLKHLTDSKFDPISPENQKRDSTNPEASPSNYLEIVTSSEVIQKINSGNSVISEQNSEASEKNSSSVESHQTTSSENQMEKQKQTILKLYQHVFETRPEDLAGLISRTSLDKFKLILEVLGETNSPTLSLAVIGTASELGEYEVPGNLEASVKDLMDAKKSLAVLKWYEYSFATHPDELTIPLQEFSLDERKMLLEVMQYTNSSEFVSKVLEVFREDMPEECQKFELKAEKSTSGNLCPSVTSSKHPDDVEKKLVAENSTENQLGFRRYFQIQDYISADAPEEEQERCKNLALARFLQVFNEQPDDLTAMLSRTYPDSIQKLRDLVKDLKFPEGSEAFLKLLESLSDVETVWSDESLEKAMRAMKALGDDDGDSEEILDEDSKIATSSGGPEASQKMDSGNPEASEKDPEKNKDSKIGTSSANPETDQKMDSEHCPDNHKDSTFTTSSGSSEAFEENPDEFKKGKQPETSKTNSDSEGPLVTTTSENLEIPEENIELSSSNPSESSQNDFFEIATSSEMSEVIQKMDSEDSENSAISKENPDDCVEEEQQKSSEKNSVESHQTTSSENQMEKQKQTILKLYQHVFETRPEDLAGLISRSSMDKFKLILNVLRGFDSPELFSAVLSAAINRDKDADFESLKTSEKELIRAKKCMAVLKWYEYSFENLPDKIIKFIQELSLADRKMLLEVIRYSDSSGFVSKVLEVFREDMPDEIRNFETRAKKSTSGNLCPSVTSSKNPDDVEKKLVDLRNTFFKSYKNIFYNQPEDLFMSLARTHSDSFKEILDLFDDVSPADGSELFLKILNSLSYECLKRGMKAMKALEEGKKAYEDLKKSKTVPGRAPDSQNTSKIGTSSGNPGSDRKSKSKVPKASGKTLDAQNDSMTSSDDSEVVPKRAPEFQNKSKIGTSPGNPKSNQKKDVSETSGKIADVQNAPITSSKYSEAFNENPDDVKKGKHQTPSKKSQDSEDTLMTTTSANLENLKPSESSQNRLSEILTSTENPEVGQKMNFKNSEDSESNPDAQKATTSSEKAGKQMTSEPSTGSLNTVLQKTNDSKKKKKKAKTSYSTGQIDKQTDQKLQKYEKMERRNQYLESQMIKMTQNKEQMAIKMVQSDEHRKKDREAMEAAVKKADLYEKKALMTLEIEKKMKEKKKILKEKEKEIEKLKRTVSNRPDPSETIKNLASKKEKLQKTEKELRKSKAQLSQQNQSLLDEIAQLKLEREKDKAKIDEKQDHIARSSTVIQEQNIKLGQLESEVRHLNIENTSQCRRLNSEKKNNSTQAHEIRRLQEELATVLEENRNMNLILSTVSLQAPRRRDSMMWESSRTSESSSGPFTSSRPTSSGSASGMPFRRPSTSSGYSEFSTSSRPTSSGSASLSFGMPSRRLSTSSGVSESAGPSTSSRPFGDSRLSSRRPSTSSETYEPTMPFPGASTSSGAEESPEASTTTSGASTSSATRITVDELQTMKVDFENNDIMERAKVRIKKLLIRNDHPDTKKVAEEELAVLEESIRRHLEILNLNIRILVLTDDVAKLLPIPEDPKMSERFENLYQTVVNTDCPICLSFMETDLMTCGQCHCEYHSECLLQWLKEHKPVCTMCSRLILDDKEYPELG